MEKELYDMVKNKVAHSIFRNKSHVIEHAVETFLKGEQKGE